MMSDSGACRLPRLSSAVVSCLSPAWASATILCDRGPYLGDNVPCISTVTPCGWNCKRKNSSPPPLLPAPPLWQWQSRFLVSLSERGKYPREFWNSNRKENPTERRVRMNAIQMNCTTIWKENFNSLLFKMENMEEHFIYLLSSFRNAHSTGKNELVNVIQCEWQSKPQCISNWSPNNLSAARVLEEKLRAWALPQTYLGLNSGLPLTTYDFGEVIQLWASLFLLKNGKETAHLIEWFWEFNVWIYTKCSSHHWIQLADIRQLLLCFTFYTVLLLAVL